MKNSKERISPRRTSRNKWYKRRRKSRNKRRRKSRRKRRRKRRHLNCLCAFLRQKDYNSPHTNELLRSWFASECALIYFKTLVNKHFKCAYKKRGRFMAVRFTALERGGVSSEDTPCRLAIRRLRNDRVDPVSLLIK